MKSGDDLTRLFSEVQADTLASTDDILSFVKKASKGEGKPTRIVKTIDYISDEGMRITTVREFYDDFVKTSQEIKNFQDDIVKTLGKGKAGAGGSLDDIIKISDDVTKPPSRGNTGRLLYDALEQLNEETQFKIIEKPGERVLMSSNDIIVAPGVTPNISADISKDMKDLNSEINNVNIILDTGTGEKQKTNSSKGTTTDDATKLITEIEQEIKQIQKQGEIFDIKPEFDVKTRTKIKTTRTIYEHGLDFSIKDFYNEINDISKEQRQLYISLTAQLEPPKPKSKKTKIKEKPRKRPKVMPKRKKPKKSSKKRKDKGGEWAIWIGYEPLFEI